MNPPDVTAHVEPERQQPSDGKHYFLIHELLEHPRAVAPRSLKDEKGENSGADDHKPANDASVRR